MKLFIICCGLFVAWVCVETINTIQADTTQIPPVRGQMRLEISKIPDTNSPPPLPQSIIRARLRWVEGDIYKLENVDPGDTIISPNKPTVTRGKTGWVLTF